MFVESARAEVKVLSHVAERQSLCDGFPTAEGSCTDHMFVRMSTRVFRGRSR